MESKFLSEVFSLEDFSRNGINILSQGTGAGKTTLALGLMDEIPNCKALYLIDTTNGKESLLKDERIVVYSEQWRKFVDNTLIPVSELENKERQIEIAKLVKAEKEIEIIFNHFQNKPVVMTYHQFGTILQSYSNFLEFLDIIILDEAHNLIQYYNMEKGSRQKDILRTNPSATKEQISMHLRLTSPLYLTVSNLSKIAEMNSYAIAMTATPNKFLKMMEALELETKQIETDLKLVAYETLNTIFYSDIYNQMGKLPSNTKAIVFIPNIKDMIKMVGFIDDKLSHKSIAIWSIHNRDFPMNEEQLKVREYLKENCKLPEDIDILIINRSYETGINIFDEEIEHMIIHTSEKDVQIQVRGRLRMNLPFLYLYKSNEKIGEIELKEKYIGKKLFSEEQEKLVEELNIIKNGRQLKIRAICNLLEEQFWKIERGKSGSKRYIVLKHKITI